MNEHFVERTRCPCCLEARFQILRELPYADPVMRRYLDNFYRDVGGVDHEALAGAAYSVAHCDACGAFFQRDIPDDHLPKALAMPADAADRASWLEELGAIIPAMPVVRDAVRLHTALCAVFKLRPGPLELDRVWGWRERVLLRLRRQALPQARLLEALDAVGGSLIVFERRNVVKRAISSYRMLRERKSQFVRRNDGPSRIPPEALREEIERYEAYRAMAVDLRARAGARSVPCLTIEYEAIVREPRRVFERILEALEIPTPPNLDVLMTGSRFQKFTSPDLSRVLLNFDELCEALAGTPYAAQLRDTNA